MRIIFKPLNGWQRDSTEFVAVYLMTYIWWPALGNGKALCKGKYCFVLGQYLLWAIGDLIVKKALNRQRVGMGTNIMLQSLWRGSDWRLHVVFFRESLDF